MSLAQLGAQRGLVVGSAGASDASVSRRPRLSTIKASSFVIANESDDEPDDNQDEVITDVVNAPVGSTLSPLRATAPSARNQ